MLRIWILFPFTMLSPRSRRIVSPFFPQPDAFSCFVRRMEYGDHSSVAGADFPNTLLMMSTSWFSSAKNTWVLSMVFSALYSKAKALFSAGTSISRGLRKRYGSPSVIVIIHVESSVVSTVSELTDSSSIAIFTSMDGSWTWSIPGLVVISHEASTAAPARAMMIFFIS